MGFASRLLLGCLLEFVDRIRRVLLSLNEKVLFNWSLELRLDLSIKKRLIYKSTYAFFLFAKKAYACSLFDYLE